MLVVAFLRKQRGAVALEAMLSIILLFIFFFVLWGVAVAIHNQSRMQTATQLAAQGALLTYDRNAYKGFDAERAADAAGKAERIARSLYAENACGMIAAPFTNELPAECADTAPSEIPGFRAEVACAPTLFDEFAAANCGQPGSDIATRVRVEAEGNQPLLILSGDSGDNEDLGLTLRGRAATYSYSPQGVEAQ